MILIFPHFSSVVDCGVLLKPNNGVITIGETTFGSVADFSCSAGFTLSGAESRRCGAEGMWSGIETTCISKCSII